MSNILTQGQTTLIEIKDGTDGVSIVSVINYYLNTNSKKAPTYEKDNTTESTESTESTKILDISGWNTVYMEPTKEYPYSWKIEVTTWSDGHQTWTKPYLISIASEATSIKTIRFYRFGPATEETPLEEIKAINITERKFMAAKSVDDKGNALTYYTWFTDNPLDLKISDIQKKIYGNDKTITQIETPIYYVDKKIYYLNGNSIKVEFGDITEDSTFEWIRKVMIFEGAEDVTTISGGKISTKFLTVGNNLEVGTLKSPSSSESGLDTSYTLYYSSKEEIAILIVPDGMHIITPDKNTDYADYYYTLYAEYSNYFPNEKKDAKVYYELSFFSKEGVSSKNIITHNINFRKSDIVETNQPKKYYAVKNGISLGYSAFSGKTYYVFDFETFKLGKQTNNDVLDFTEVTGLSNNDIVQVYSTYEEDLSQLDFVTYVYSNGVWSLKTTEGNWQVIQQQSSLKFKFIDASSSIDYDSVSLFI